MALTREEILKQAREGGLNLTADQIADDLTIDGMDAGDWLEAMLGYEGPEDDEVRRG